MFLLIIPGKDITRYLRLINSSIFFSAVSSFGGIAFFPVPFPLSDTRNVFCFMGLLDIVIHRIRNQHLWSPRADEFYKHKSSGNGRKFGLTQLS